MFCLQNSDFIGTFSIRLAWDAYLQSRNIITLPLRRKQISQSPDRLTLAYLFYTIRPEWDAYYMMMNGIDGLQG